MFEVVENDLVSELRSVVEDLRSESLPELPDARIEEDFAELHLAVEQLDAERLRRLAEIDRRRLYERDGHLSAASWLVARFRMAWGVAREQVRIAHGLVGMERTRRALEAGEVSMSSVRVLANARTAEPEAYAIGETQLVEAARRHTVADLQRIVAFWRDRVASEATTGGGAEAVRARRRLHASATLGGMVRVDGDLDAETGESLLTALHAVLDGEARSRGADDDRTPAQRRADALGRDLPPVAGRRGPPGRGRRATAPHGDGGRRGARTRRRWRERRRRARGGVRRSRRRRNRGARSHRPARHRGGSAAGVRRLGDAGGDGSPLGAARRRPANAGRAGSIAAGVDRAGSALSLPRLRPTPVWCDAHHIDHWAHGGATTLPNLLLLCRRHHGLVHRTGGFTLELVDGRPVFRRPDGSDLEDRAPP